MYLAYLDESGDDGTVRSPTRYLVLGCLLVPDHQWLACLDQVIAFRRWLRERFQIPPRQELKGNHLARGSGAVAHLPPRQRMWIYRRAMELQSRLPVKIFAVAIDKAAADAKGWPARIAAWTFALQRINRYCGDDGWASLMPDEGQSAFIRRKVRAMRRYHVVNPFFGGRPIRFDLTRIIEDPNERSSRDSYFIQLVDLAAHAAHRSSYVDPRPDIDTGLWDALGSVRLEEVNRLRATRQQMPPAIVTYP